MSYDLMTVRVGPGEDPEERVDALAEAWDEEIPEGDLARREQAVVELIAAYRQVFGADAVEVADHEGANATLLLFERHVSVDVYADLSDINLSYAEPRSIDWLIAFAENVGRAGALGGQNVLFDPQVGAVVEPQRDRALIADGYEGGVAIVAELKAQHERAESGGFLKRLFRRG